jgi:H+/Cl- antiporter ClcA
MRRRLKEEAILFISVIKWVFLAAITGVIVGLSTALSSFAENPRLLSLGMNAPVVAVKTVALKGFLLRRDSAKDEWRLRALARRASFLKVLNWSTALSFKYSYYFILLPVALFLSALIIKYLAPDAEGHGTEKVIEAIHIFTIL